MVTADGVLMSIRPQYAEAILSGEKTVELRRRRPSFSAGTTVLIYSSAPLQTRAGDVRGGRRRQRRPGRPVAPRR